MAKKQTKKKGAAKGGKPTRPAQPLVALYNLDEGTERGDAVRAVISELGVRIRTVSAADLGNPVGAIVGMQGFHRSEKPYEGEIPETEFMLLHNMSSAQLDALLMAMREADCSVGCKAQVTQFNRLWPFATLIQEVSREHAVMTGE